MFTAQWFSLGGMRCSPLNAALSVRVWQRIDEVFMIRSHRSCCAAYDVAKNIRRLEKVICNKILPSMRNLSDISTSLVDEDFEDLYSYKDAEEDINYDARFEFSRGQSIDLEEDRFSIVRQVFYNSVVITLSSYFEQSMLIVLAAMRDEKVCDLPRNLHFWNAMLKEFKNQGCDLEELKGYKAVDRIRQLANAIKHGSGASASAVEEQQSWLLGSAHDPKKGIRDSFQFQSKPISTPMIYDEIAIIEIDITIYLDEVKDFLLTLSKYNCQGYACLANHENT
ncbi:hypothetical protein P5E03_22570 [Vibrio parahaemolyticus]|nr:hypothetical protein [Vibrio parahaemolyticus]HBC3421952.1 hypothetical protein [Vibrio parahaemolyticus]HBC3908018.1 hypothetical protein [Vibrio parahaemolyticus]